MKTWEMIKELTENPNKKFKNKNTPYTVVTCNSVNFLVNKEGNYISIPLDSEWEEIKKPVRFMEAIRAFDGGKDIYCEYGDKTYHYPCKPYRGLEDVSGNGVPSYEILAGKWYIKD